jgi:2-dehydropantoate 2-reductase
VLGNVPAMRFVIYGAGAIGGVVGGRLAQHGHEVVLVARGAHLDALRSGGLRLVDGDGTATLRLPVAGHPGEIDWQPGDVVLLTVKSQQTVAALNDLGAVAPADLPLVCAQNGVQNERMALRRFAHVHAMCVMCPATHLEPGVVEVGRGPVTGTFDLGRYPSGTDEVDHEVAAALRASTFLSEPRADIMAWKYRKLLLNLGNAIGAVAGPGAHVADLARLARAEGHAVLAAAGIAVTPRDVEQARRAEMGANRFGGDGDRGSSSWQSLQRGTGSIEADYLNGEIVLLGRLHGVPTPVNGTLQELANDAARRGARPGDVTVAEVQAALDRAVAAAGADAA